MMSKKSRKLAPAHTIIVPAWAWPTEPYRAFRARVLELAGGFTTTKVEGAWKTLASETSDRFESRVTMEDYASDTHLERAFNDFTIFLLTKEQAVYRERGPLAWIEPR